MFIEINTSSAKFIRTILIITLFLAASCLTGCEYFDDDDDVKTTAGTGGGTVATSNDTPAPAPTPTDTNTDPSTEDFPSISGTGIVWKPVSEGDRKLVVLLPTSYGSPEIGVYTIFKEKVGNGDYKGRTNGNRATYRFSKPGSGYESPALLKVGSKYFIVKSTKSRYN